MSLEPGAEIGASNAPNLVSARVSRHLLPVLIVAFVVAFLDRINIGFAQLDMRETLKFGQAVYGAGAGIFFLGYFLLEVPSNLLLEKIGARKTLFRIMVCWGGAAVATSFVRTPLEFYIVRFMLGAFEAGFFPGVILYLTYWYPSARRAQIIATFMLAPLIAGVVAGPLSGLMLKYMSGVLGLQGWQWLFIIQGFPAVILGFVVHLTLPNGPDEAKWLTDTEKDVIRKGLLEDQRIHHKENDTNLRLLLKPAIFALASIYAMIVGCNYTMAFYTPSLIKSWGINDILSIGFCASLPNVLGMAGIVLISRSSDKRRERRLHFLASALLGTLGAWGAFLLHGNVVGSIIGLCVVGIGLGATTPLFVTMVSEYLPRSNTAAGIAMVTSLGNLGPVITPSIAALIIERGGNPKYTLVFVIAMLASAFMGVVLTFRSKGLKALGRADDSVV